MHWQVRFLHWAHKSDLLCICPCVHSRIVITDTILCVVKIVNWKKFAESGISVYRERIMSFGPLGVVISVSDEKKLIGVEFFKSTSGFGFGHWQEIFLF